MMRNITSVVSLLCRYGLSLWGTAPVAAVCLFVVRALPVLVSWTGGSIRSTTRVSSGRGHLASPLPYAMQQRRTRCLPLAAALFLLLCLLCSPLSVLCANSSLNGTPTSSHFSSDPLVTFETSENETDDPHSSGLCERGGVSALGMESGRIPDSALTASSAFEMRHVGPANARLRTDIVGGAWCPSKQLGPESSGSEWIQVDLGDLYVVTGVATQGRFGKGMGIEYTEAYELLYSREATPTKWIVWKNWDGRSQLEGNIDPNTVEEHQLERAVVGARHIRLVPLSNVTRSVCLRFELYGCPYRGPISYSSPVFANQTDSKLADSLYDGALGKLTDGIKASQVEGQESVWVGWPQKISAPSSVELIFEFEQVSNFTTVSINCLNSFSRHVRVFSAATVWMSLDKQQWSSPPIRFEYQADNVIELPRDVIIHLQYRIGRFVRIELTYDSQWLQISEVSFDCTPLSGNLSLAQVEDLFERVHSAQYNQASDEASADGTRYIMPEDPLAKGGKASLYPEPGHNVKYSLIVICLCTLGLVVTSLVISLAFKKLNNRKNNVFREIADIDFESENANINLKNMPKEASPLYCEPKEISSLQEEAEYAIPDVICPSNLSKTLNLQKAAPNAVACKTLQINPRFYASSDIICAKQNIYGARPGTQILNAFDIGNLRSLNPTQQYQKQLSQQQQTPLLDTFGCRKRSAAFHNARTSFYSDAVSAGYGVRTYSESEIGVLQSLGKSKFGDVLLCNIPASGKNRLAVVRTVNDLSFKTEFVVSMQAMRHLSLQCDRFARLFGVIETPTYFASITEHADCDLSYFLRKSSPDHLSFETLLYIGSEIATGGAYLESIKQTHRDISTRNVIVYEKNFTVKLTDVAAFEDKYALDYYNGMPLRWMSPESVVRAEFTAQSEVYAFGVCLWEILVRGKCRPFADYSDEDLISAVYAHIDGGEPFPRLPRPAHCTNDIFDLLEECCNCNEHQRPSFKEICLFLQRKTLGLPKPMQGALAL